MSVTSKSKSFINGRKPEFCLGDFDMISGRRHDTSVHSENEGECEYPQKIVLRKLVIVSSPQA